MVSLKTENWETKIIYISNETEHYHNVKHEFKAKKFAVTPFKNQYKQSWSCRSLTYQSSNRTSQHLQTIGKKCLPNYQNMSSSESWSHRFHHTIVSNHRIDSDHRYYLQTERKRNYCMIH